KDRHPRTVVGLDREGKTLTILIVDGRRPGVSVGMRYEELAQEMLRLGCWDAVNLDGGGSTVLAMRKPDSRDYVILNTPSDGRERPVANVLGIRVKPSRSTARRR
ncbi:MAG TPA: phosphodiester glycosidase family protein, partial [Phycisphaerae bacterium]|nr:phosphodiester glycosidase family protein [Phycisphaerae bacterium]